MHATSSLLMKPSKPKPVSPKLATALRAMIHDGLELHDAAERAEISTFRLRQSLENPHVLQFIRAEKQMRLESVRLGNINDLARIKAGDGAAAVSAIRMLEEMATDRAALAASQTVTTPGVTINIINGLADQRQTDEGLLVQPTAGRTLVEHDHGPQSPESAHESTGGKNGGDRSRS
jgi:hypothetical protein